MTATSSIFSHYVSTRRTVRWLSVLLIVSSAAAWMAVGFDFAEVRLLSRGAVGSEIRADDMATYTFLRGIAAKTQFTLLAATAIGFMAWLYRSRANLRAFGTRHLRYSRNWAVFGFLIPLLNLVRPYQVVREVWKASDPSTIDPASWMDVDPPNLLPLWWGTFVAYVVLECLELALTSSASHDFLRLQIARSVALLADVMAAVSVSAAYFVVAGISDAQQEKWARLSPPPGL